MAKFRTVSVKFWSDPFVEGLTSEKKYFFLYLITNEHTSQCGIYEITVRQMANETGYNSETVEKLIHFFEKCGRIKYGRRTKEVAIKNFVKHNPQGSPKVKAFVESELAKIKDRLLIPYVYGMDTLSQEEKEEEQTEEKEETKEPLRALPFESKLFEESWNGWKKYRKEKRQSLKPSTIELQLKFLGARPESEAIEIINQSIMNGWTGLFDLKTNGKPKPIQRPLHNLQ